MNVYGSRRIVLGQLLKLGPQSLGYLRRGVNHRRGVHCSSWNRTLGWTETDCAYCKTQFIIVNSPFLFLQEPFLRILPGVLCLPSPTTTSGISPNWRV